MSKFFSRKPLRRKLASRLGSPERLESRLMMDCNGDDLSPLCDEFNNAASINQWSEIHQAEGWGQRGAQFNQWTVNSGADGRMVLQPHSVVWHDDYRGPLVFKEVTGDFVVTTRMRVTDRDNVGGSDADNVPGDAQFTFGGLMIRTPRAIANGASDWQAGSRSTSGNVGENYVFHAMGYTSGTNQFSLETNNTRNSASTPEFTAVGQTPNEVELRIARIGSAVILLRRLDGQTDWTVQRRYSRPDMPQTLQVGITAYTDWEKANDFTPVVHNSNVLAPGQVTDPTPGQPFNPDLTAGFDYTRFNRPQVPAALAGVNLVTTATDAQLLSFLGDNAGDPPPDLPVVTIVATDANAAEAGLDPAVFTVTRTGDTSAPLTVNYTVGGTATSNSDFTVLSGNVTIAAGQASATVTVTPINDTTFENNETVRLTIANHATYTVGAANAALATIVSDDALAGDDLASLSDEFGNAASINQWNEIHDVEGWGPRGAQFNQWTVNNAADGRMVLQPHSNVWYEDWRGPLVFKEVTGDFIVSTKVRITDRDDVGGSDADNVPGDSQFSLGGLMIRTPRAITNGAADWVPGTRNNVGNVGENFIFFSMGSAPQQPSRFSFEVKTTRNSESNLEVTSIGLGPNEVELRIARIGSTVIVLHRLDGEADWTVHRRYSRPDMPQTLQVGMVAYTDWEKANDFTPVVHNSNVLAAGRVADPTPGVPFNPDVTASFDYTRFERPQVPAELAGVNLLTATNAQLLSFLGQGGDANPDPPTQTRVGMNISTLTDWDSAWIFRDAFQRARPFGPLAHNPATGEIGFQSATGEGPALAVDENGWVTSLPTWTHSNGTVYQQYAETVIFTGEALQPAGIYRAEWEGNGDLAMGYVTESGTMADGRRYALVNMPYGAHFTMMLRSTDPANPVRNIRLWMPDFNGQSLVGRWQPGDNGTPFHPLFLDRLDEFDTLRFMDLMNTNLTDIVTWADRSRLTDASQSDGDLAQYFHTHGLAPEYLIELSNETDANPWFNMPHQANDDYVRQLATLVRDTLDPDLKIYVEWSNELWNAFFPTYSWIVAQTRLPQNAGLDFFQIAGREMARDFDIWTDVFAGQEDRIVRVVAGQQANPWLVEQLLANVNGRVDAVSCTAYAGLGTEIINAYTSATTADDIINDLLNIAIPWSAARLGEHEQIVEDYEVLLARNLEFVTYESGSHIMGAPNDFWRPANQPPHPALNAALEASHSPRLYEVYQTLLAAVNNAGVDLYNEFSFTSHSSVQPYGFYGVLQDMSTPLSEAHKLRSLYDYIAANSGDDTNSPPVLGTLSDRTIDEGSLLSFTVTATDPDGDALTYRLGAGSPAGASINPTTGVFTWTPSESQGTGFYDVFVSVDDLTHTRTGQFRVTVNEVNSAPVLNTITNRTVSAGSPVSFTATATDPDLPAQTLTYSLVGAPTGASITPAGVITWTPTAAQAGATHQITVRVTDNGTPALSDDETFSVTVLDLPRLSISDTTVTEGDSGSLVSQFLVTLNAPSTRAVTVSYATVAGTAVAGTSTTGGDFQSRSGTLRFAPGETRKSISVPVLGDRRDETDETFSVRLSNAVDAVFADDEAIGTIVDNDPLPTLSINRVSVTERDVDAAITSLTVRLSAASGRPVTVSFATANETAIAGSDYDATSGTLTFAPGETIKTIPVTIRPDRLSELSETLAVQLSGATNANLSSTPGRVTILDNDPLPVASIGNASIQEGSSGSREMVFTVNLTAVSGRPVTVQYATANGTARAGTDYVASSGTLTFAPGETSRTIRIAILGDSLLEPDETFSVRLSSAVGATLGTSRGLGTILNDD